MKPCFITKKLLFLESESHFVESDYTSKCWWSVDVFCHPYMILVEKIAYKLLHGGQCPQVIFTLHLIINHMQCVNLLHGNKHNLEYSPNNNSILEDEGTQC